MGQDDLSTTCRPSHQAHFEIQRGELRKSGPLCRSFFVTSNSSPRTRGEGSIPFRQPAARLNSLCTSSLSLSPLQSQILAIANRQAYVALEKTEESEQSAKNKRREQVRKAQIQHRARKANYTKQLEADIAAIREQIEDVERDRRTLRLENQAIRAQLSAPQQQIGAKYGQRNGNPGFYAPPTSNPQYATTSYGFDIDSVGLDYLDVAGAGLDDMLGAPGGYGVYYEDGSPVYASSSRGSLGIFGSPQYIDSGSNTPYTPLPETHSLDQSLQAIDYMSGVP